MESRARRFRLGIFAWVTCVITGGGCDYLIGIPTGSSTDYSLCGPAGNGGCGGGSSGGSDGGSAGPDAAPE